MNKGGSHADTARSAVYFVPACQWSFNKALCFHYIGGDSSALFQRSCSELLHQHISMIDDKGAWEARLHQIFSGKTRFDLAPPSWSQPYAIIHLAIHSTRVNVAYAAGFAYRAGQPQPAAPELELAALGILQVLETERTRMARFLHDVVAQCLSSTGLQLELMRLDDEMQDLELPGRTREIQRSLEEALESVRRFSAEEENESLHNS
jgi:signal transduction histidine kinase